MAGASRRLGQPKQNVVLDGHTLLSRSVQLARVFFNELKLHSKPIVVSGAYLQQDCEALSHLGLTSLVEHHFNPRWREGMDTSRDVAQAAAGTDGVLILLVDQYRLEVSDLRRVYEAWLERPERPSIAAFADTIGPPVILPASFAQSDAAENRSAGNRAGKHRVSSLNPTRVLVPNAEFDLDTPADAEAAKRFFG